MTGSDSIGGHRGPQRRGALAALAGAALLLPGAGGAAGTFVQRRGHLFGSAVELQALPVPAVDAVLDAVWRELVAIHRRWNAWKPGELGDLNLALREGRGAVVSPALRRVLEQAKALESLSAGLFNPAIGGLVGAWGFHADRLREGPAPDAATLAAWRAAMPRMADLRIDGNRIESSQPRLQLDLGGYAKGVAVDAAIDRLRRAGVGGAVVDLGGNLAAFGSAGDRPWRVGLRDPAMPGAWIAVVRPGPREAIITSGIYERWRIVPGAAPASHILDPLTAAPAAGLVSVTVLHPSAAWADAAATALLVAGPSRWSVVARRMQVSDVLVVARDGRAVASRSMAMRLGEVAQHWQGRITVV